MKNFEVISFANADELARAVASAWLDEIAAAQRAGKPHCVALSGGRITLKFFAEVVRLLREGHRSDFPKFRDGKLSPLPNAHFFWADERCVPSNHPDSNFAAADENFFKPLGIAPDNIHRIHGKLPPEQAAEQATAEIRHIVPADESGQPLLDVIFLGMGEDGHVASLFPGEPELIRNNPAVFRAIHNSPKPPPDRVTLGYAAVAAAKQVWVLASGTGKEAAFAESLSPTGTTPLARVLQSRQSTKVFTDIQA